MPSPTEAKSIPLRGTLGSEEHCRGSGEGLLTHRLGLQSDRVRGLQHPRLKSFTKKTRGKAASTRGLPGPSSSWILSSSPLQLLAVWLIIQFAPLKRAQCWTEMSVGMRGRKSVCEPPAAASGGWQWKCSQADSSPECFSWETVMTKIRLKSGRMTFFTKFQTRNRPKTLQGGGVCGCFLCCWFAKEKVLH